MVQNHDASGSFVQGLRVILLAVLPLCLAATVVEGQVTVTVLGNPSNNTTAYGISGDQVVGLDNGAVLWSVSGAQPVTLDPSGYFGASVYATNGSQQGGLANAAFGNGNEHAFLWNGSATQNYTDLHPTDVANAVHSYVQALSDTQQGGQVTLSGFGTVAALWSGSAASYVNLNPTGSTGSGVSAMVAGLQGGYAILSGYQHAALWSGTAASFQDLNPTGTTDSVILAMSGAQQGGQAYFGTTPHAALWSGTAGSFVDLDPGVAGGSSILAMAGSYQVGVVGTEERAALWQGTSGSYIDLQPYISSVLGAGFGTGVLRGVAIDGSTLYIVGQAENLNTSEYHAVLLTVAVPEPAVSAAAAGLLVFGVAYGRRKLKPSKD